MAAEPTNTHGMNFILLTTKRTYKEPEIHVVTEETKKISGESRI